MIAVQLWIWQIQERTLIVSCPQDLPQCQVERSANIARISLAGWYWHWLWWPQLFLSCNCCVTCRRWRCSSDYNVYLAPHYLRSGPCQPLPGHPRTSTLPPSGGGTKKIIAPTDWLTDQTQISSSSGLTLTLRRDEGGDLTRQSEEAGRSQSQLLLHDIVWTRVLLSCLADKALKCEL